MTRAPAASFIALIAVLAGLAMLGCALLFACGYQRAVSSAAVPLFPRVLPVSAGLAWAAAGASVLKGRAGPGALAVCGAAGAAVELAVLIRLVNLGWLQSPGGVPSAALLACFALVMFVGALGAFLSRAASWGRFALGSGVLAALFFLAGGAA